MGLALWVFITTFKTFSANRDYPLQELTNETSSLEFLKTFTLEVDILGIKINGRPWRVEFHDEISLF